MGNVTEHNVLICLKINRWDGGKKKKKKRLKGGDWRRLLLGINFGVWFWGELDSGVRVGVGLINWGVWLGLRGERGQFLN